VLVRTGVTSKKDLWLYVLKVPVGIKEPFRLKGELEDPKTGRSSRPC
jgi:hypothetical protein